MPRGTTACATLMTVLALALTGCGPDQDARSAGAAEPESTPAGQSGGDMSALCAMPDVLLDGEVFGWAPGGSPDRTPELGGRTATAEYTTCDDLGDGEPTTEEFILQEIAGVPMTTAVWGFDGLLVRRGASLPAFTDEWYGKPSCDLDEPFRLVGRWLGITSEKEVRFDGDLRPPLRIELYAEPGEGSPAALERYTLRLHDDGDAEPGLDKQMAEEALWSSRALLDVTVTCEDERFVAQSFALQAAS